MSRKRVESQASELLSVVREANISGPLTPMLYCDSAVIPLSSNVPNPSHNVQLDKIFTSASSSTCIDRSAELDLMHQGVHDDHIRSILDGKDHSYKGAGEEGSQSHCSLPACVPTIDKMLLHMAHSSSSSTAYLHSQPQPILFVPAIDSCIGQAVKEESSRIDAAAEYSAAGLRHPLSISAVKATIKGWSKCKKGWKLSSIYKRERERDSFRTKSYTNPKSEHLDLGNVCLDADIFSAVIEPQEFCHEHDQSFEEEDPFGVQCGDFDNP